MDVNVRSEMRAGCLKKVKKATSKRLPEIKPIETTPYNLSVLSTHRCRLMLSAGDRFSLMH